MTLYTVEEFEAFMKKIGENIGFIIQDVEVTDFQQEMNMVQVRLVLNVVFNGEIVRSYKK